MFEKELFLNKKVFFRINENPLFEKENKFVFGFPLINSIDKISSDKEVLNTISGRFCLIEIKDNQLFISTDITGGFRLYYIETDDTIYFSDDFHFLVQFVGLQNLNQDKVQIEYYKQHRYTLGDKALFKEIKKVIPAAYYKLTEKEFFVDTYFKFNLKKSVSQKEYFNKVFDSLNKTIEFIKEQSKENRVFLSFSGGLDSTLLAMLLKNQKIAFTAVFFNSNPSYKANLSDLQRAKFFANKYDIPIEIIDVDLENDADLNEIVQLQLLDRHFSLLHYAGHKLLVSKYGKNIIIINGQSSDSIFSFGPSKEDINDFIRRYILYFPKGIMYYLFVLLINFIKKNNFKKKHTVDDNNLRIIEEDQYFFLRKEKSTCVLSDYSPLLVRILDKSSSYDCSMMYLKVFSFLQGSDNQVLFNSTRNLACNLILPYTTTEIIYSTIINKNNFVELFSPKYILKNIFKKLAGQKYFYAPPKYSTNKELMSSIDYEKKMDMLFFEKLKAEYNIDVFK